MDRRERNTEETQAQEPQEATQAQEQKIAAGLEEISAKLKKPGADGTSAYHLLGETAAKAQADHLLRTIGDDIGGLLIAVNSESYNAPYSYLTPGNATLQHFITSLKGHICDHR